MVDQESAGVLTSKLNDLYLQHLTWKAVADHLGVSPAYLSDVINGRREPGDAILKPLGLTRVVFYQQISE